MALNSIDQVGVVAIGRNEGERLKTCLRSLQAAPLRIYVDSGSADSSVGWAQSQGVEVVELPCPPPFTAARARNAGLARLKDCAPGAAFVQMIDGDCEAAPGWLDAALAAITSDDRIAAVAGRLRERHPQASVYNRLCDAEWDVLVGEVESCGGIALFRIEALSQAGGFAPDLIAGEEPDLCLRMRALGWKILSIDAEMASHDAAMTRFSQWWKRSQRSGHAFAELVHRHGRRSNRQWIRQLASFTLWGGAAIVAVLLGIGALLAGSGALAAAALGIPILFAVQVTRLAIRRAREGAAPRHAWPWAAFLMLGKLPQLQGALQFHGRRLSGAGFKLIEYKS